MKLYSWRNALAAAALVAPFGLVSAPAQAIPGDGAGTDTAGTSSSISPRTLTAGSTINFSVSGFPAGKVVSIKIDDGLFCSDSGTHGACVVHMQRIDSNGTASGSFVLPGDLKPGKHWLRYLSAEDIADRPGATLGYTRRGGSDFTIVAGGSSPANQGGGQSGNRSSDTPGSTNDSGSSSGTGTEPNASATASTSASGDQGAAGAEPGAPIASPGAEIALKAGPNQPTAQPSATASATPGPTPESAISEPTAAVSSEQRRVPWLGIGGGVALLGAAALLLLLPRRRVRA